jgi:hypothetical protein
MQDAMQRQNFHLVGNRVAPPRGVFAGDVRRNCNLSSNAPGRISFRLRCWKRQYIRGLVCSAESPVKRAQIRTVRHQYIHNATQVDRSPRPQHKAFERRCTQTRDSSPEDNHPFPQRAWNSLQNKQEGQISALPRRLRFYSPEALDRSCASAAGAFPSAPLTPPPDSALFPPASSSICCSATSVLCSS